MKPKNQISPDQEDRFTDEVLDATYWAAAHDAASSCGYDRDEESLVVCEVTSIRRVRPEWFCKNHPEFLNAPGGVDPAKVLSVDWQTWALPKSFDQSFDKAAVFRSENILVDEAVLLAGKVFTYGLGPEFNWLHWDETSTESEKLPTEVFVALRELIKGDWADQIVEWAEGDDDYVSSIHPRLRAAVKRLLQLRAEDEAD